MSSLAWIAVGGPPAAFLVGIVLGYLRGVGANDDDVQAQAKRIGELEERIAEARAALRRTREELLALSAPRMSREQRDRVLDRVANGSGLH